jgi:hypothetical protein
MGGHSTNDEPTAAGSDGTQSVIRWLEMSLVPIGRSVCPAPTAQNSTNVGIATSRNGYLS